MAEKSTFTVEEATRKLEYFCSYQDRCHQEVRQKLEQMGMIPEAVDHIMVHLITHDFLNEERFSKSFARGKFNIKNWGRVRIASELKQRNIAPINIKTALKELDDADYSQSLEALAVKRLGQLQEKDKEKKKKKLADYLLYRGWESYLVYELVFRLIP